jgi:predicted nucleotidyltransferase
MEDALRQKALAYISRAEYYLAEKRFEMAYNAYMDALHTIGAYLVYLDTGMLMSVREMMGILESRHPEVHGVIARYSRVTSFDEGTLTAMRKEVERLRDSVFPTGPD